jgi:hypothetical protein
MALCAAGLYVPTAAGPPSGAQVRRRRGGAYPPMHLYGYFGLVSLINLKYGGSWAKA